MTKIFPGDVFGAITVLHRERCVTPSGKKATRYLVRCTCGGERIISLNAVRFGSLCIPCGTKVAAEKKRTGNDVGKDRLYRIFHNMKQRCNNPTNHSYYRYGAKGIRILWTDYKSFREWALSHGYENHLTIERINPRGHYEPSNCEWITGAENTRRAFTPWRKESHFPIEMLWGAA